MALINCTECGCELSEYADKCPKCGCPTKIILGNIKNNQVNNIQQLDDSINEQEVSLKSPVLVDSMGKKRNLAVPSVLFRNKWIIISVGLLFCVILLVLINRKPSIADISIDKVTPELKNVVQKYDKLDDFSEGLAAVCKDGKWGFIDKLGKEVIPCRYDEVSDFKFGVSVVKSNEKEGIINIHGEHITPLKYDWIDSFSFGDSLTRASLNDSQGILNEKGKVIIPFEYEEIYNFKEGLALARKDGKYGCVDKSNRVIIPFEYEGSGVYDGFSEGLIALKKDGNYGYLDKQGNIVIPFDERNVGTPFSSGLATIWKGGGGSFALENGRIIRRTPEPFMMALIDKSGNQVTDFYNGEYEDFRNGYSVVTNGINRRKGLIDCQGNMIIPLQYWLIASGWIKDGLVCVMYDTDKKGFVNLRTGELTIPCEYETTGGFAFSEGLWPVKKNGKCGFINMSNQLVIPYIYDYARDFHEGFSVVEKYGKYGYVDRYGTDTFY